MKTVNKKMQQMNALAFERNQVQVYSLHVVHMLIYLRTMEMHMLYIEDDCAEIWSTFKTDPFELEYKNLPSCFGNDSIDFEIFTLVI